MPNEVADPTLETNILPELPSDDDGQQQPTTTTTEEPTTAQPTEKKSIDLEAAMAELAGTVKQIAQPKEAPVPPPTKEQIAEFWAVYDPESTDKEFFKKWFRLNPDATQEEIQQAKELFAGVQKGLMRQAVTAAQNYIKIARQEIDQEYGPLKEYVQTAQKEATRGRFFGEYPALNDKKFNKIIDATARSLDNKTFDSEEDYFKALAEGAAGSIKDILPDFDLGAKPTTKTKPGSTPKLPRTSAGGGGGAGKGATHDALAATGSRNDIDSLSDDAE